MTDMEMTNDALPEAFTDELSDDALDRDEGERLCQSPLCAVAARQLLPLTLSTVVWRYSRQGTRLVDRQVEHLPRDQIHHWSPLLRARQKDSYYKGVSKIFHFSDAEPLGISSGWLAPQTISYSPTESLTHFLVKLVFAAPASFLSAAAVSQAVVESVSHFFMKLFMAAPANFFDAASAWQLGERGVTVAVWA